MSRDETAFANAVAIIGMAGRFPGARSVEELWRNLCAGVESISFFSAAEMEACGVSRDLLRQPGYVPAKGVVADVDLFDHEFFGTSARLAQVMDPQQRLFLECAWEALEDAGYDPDLYPGSIGIYAGSAPSTYLMHHVLPNYPRIANLGEIQITTANDKDYLPTLASYKLNLHGPSLAVQTACSSSLVAVHLACQSLLGNECDMALAGGVSIKFPERSGYLYQEGSILSPDGHCRPFDARAQGTVSSSGLGLVVLKRYEDAVADGDSIRAVLLGSAINNDGARKIGFTAPSMDGQAQVIAEALAVAGVDPATIGSIEAHGTGTSLGDPIEVAALRRVFAVPRAAGELCALGSIKSNLGHLDTAAGVAGLIKAVLSLHHGMIPPSLHFESPNPALELGDGPFFVNDRLREWRSASGLRRAGVSSFGVGGTNAHVVLEEAPLQTALPAQRPWHVLVVSARSAAALEIAGRRLADHLERNPEIDLADVAYTLQVGRRAFDHRRALVCRDTASARMELARPGGRTRHERHRGRPVAFLFPGQGAQYPGMAGELYAEEPVFRTEVDRCCDFIAASVGTDLRRLVFPPPGEETEAAGRLSETVNAQPALFVIEYALAQLWKSLGVKPQAMIGHSLGEIVCACVSGVFRLEDALQLVVARGRLMQSLPRGVMLSVGLPPADLEPLLDSRIALAAVNAGDRCVLAGESAAMADLESDLMSRGVSLRRLETSHAFHSPMMEPVQTALADLVGRLKLGAPKIPWISNVTGTWITPEEAVDPGYWAQHIRCTVRFAGGLAALLQQDQALLEVGPGTTLGSLARRVAAGRDLPIVSSLPDASPSRPQIPHLLDSLADLWLSGVAIDWKAFHYREPRRRVPLPTYPFEGQRAWLESARPAASAGSALHESESRPPESLAVHEEVRVAEIEAAVAADIASVSVRQGRILSILGEIVSDLLGIPAERIDIDLPFLEVGVDSLILIQASQVIHQRFGVKLSLAQLLEEHTTLSLVAAALDRELPPDAFAQAPAAAPVPQPEPVPAPLPARAEAPPPDVAFALPPSALQQIVSEQLQLMSRQIDLLRNATGLPAASPEVPAAALAGAAPAFPPAPAREPAAKPNEPAPAAGATALHPFAAGPVLSETKDLSTRQRRHLEALISRYCARTAESKRRTREHRPHLAENRASVGFRMRWKEMVYPLIVERSAGSRIWDLDGNEYVDLAMGFSVHLFGHSPEFVVKALEEQMRKGLQLGPQSDLAGEVASTISRMTGMERVTFTNSGTEAVMTALRLARAVTGRTRIALFDGSYHGSFDGVLARRAGSGGQRSLPSSPGVPRGMIDDMMVLDYGSPAALDALRAVGGELAAVLVEPVQSRRPGLQPREFLRQLRRLTEEVGAALIFDEVVTGFRVHPGGVQALFDVRADIATYGKVVGGGMPIGILTGRPEFMDAIDGGPWSFGDDSYPRTDKIFFAGTFCKHPLAMAAARAVLGHLEASGPGLQQRLNERTAVLVDELNGLLAAERVGARVLSFGSLFRFDFSRDLETSELLFYHLLEKGIYTWEGRNCALSTAHTDADLEHIVRAVKESIAELRSGGFFRPDDRPTERGSHHTSAPAPIQKLPLTTAQRGIWALCQLDPSTSGAFNESILCRFEGPLDVGVLRRALQRVVERHEALRVTFEADGERQVVQVRMPVDIPLIDLTDLSGEEQSGIESALSGGVQGREVFDLVHGPLLRVRLYRFASECHLLDLTVHHLVTDGWSLGLLLSELRQLYTAERQGSALELPAPTPYRWYVDLQGKRGLSADWQKTEAYWLGQFPGAVPQLDLPADRPRPPVKTYAGARLTHTLSESLLPDLRAFCRDQRCTMFILLLSVYEALLHQLASAEDLVVGITLAEQPSLGTQALMGYCLNVLPLRIGVEPGLTFRELLARTRQRLAEAQENQTYDLGRLMKRLGLRRDRSRSPIFSVAFNHERGEAWSFPGGLRIEQVGSPNIAAQYDLSWMTVEMGGTLKVHCIYSTELFERERVAGWASRYDRLLRIVVDHPEISLRALDERLRDVAMKDARERELLLGLNPAPIAYPDAGLCLHELIEEQVRRTPDAPAVRYKGATLTYAELSARAARLASRLTRLGAGPEALVGVCLERSFELIVALLGILKAGAAYVPLDPSYPRERLDAILEDLAGNGDPRPLVVTREEHRAALPERVTAGAGRIVLLAGGEPDTAPTRGSSPQGELDQLAYTIFTSGSTGRPKGAMNAHRGVVNRLLWMQQTYGLTAEDRVLQKTPFSFDVAVWELFWPLLSGATLVMAEPGMHRDSAYLADILREERITTVHFVPSLLRVFLEEPEAAACRSLRRVICSGEALPPDLVDRFFALFPLEAGPVLHNLYGPTEAAVDVTWWECAPGQERTPIGRPVANTRIHLLESLAGGLQAAPFGSQGELYIGGVQVGRGYLGRPDLTAERFLPDPFAVELGGRLYRTGDAARYSAEGVLEYLGRLDHQVKIRGFRIELEEIETVLRQHPGLRDAVVVAWEAGPGDRRLIAYLVVRQEMATADGELRRFLEQRLPDYMIPSRMIRLQALPLTSSGKVDRRSLPVPDAQRGEVETSFVSPRTGTERLLAAIWEDLLQVGGIGVHDDFFQLGGDSILAVQVTARANRAGLHLLPIQIFRHPTIAWIAAHATQEEVAPGVEPSPAVPERTWKAAVAQLAATGRVVSVVPLSPIQQGMLFHSLERQDPNRYILQLGSLLEGEVDADSLREVWRRLADRHAILRSAFLWDGFDEPVQAALEKVEIPFAEIDLRDLAPAEQELWIDEYLKAERIRGFDFQTPPLMRLSLFHLGELTHQFVWTFHHLVMDGWSERIVLDEINHLYPAIRRGTEVNLEPAVPFSVYVEWLCRRDLARAGSFWRNGLRGFDTPTPVNVPWDGAGVESGEPGIDVAQTLWSREDTDRLRHFSQSSSLTLNTLVQAAWGLLLGVSSGRRDVVFGMTVSGRPADLTGVESIVGPFLNTLPVRLVWSPEDRLRPWLQALQQRLAELRGYEFSPLVSIQGWSEIPRGLPLFESLVIFQNRPLLRAGDPTLSPDGFRVRRRGYRGGRHNFPLGLEVDPGAQLNLMLEYDRQRFPLVGAELRLRFLTGLLTAFVASPEQSLGSLEAWFEDGVRQVGPGALSADETGSASGSAYVAPHTPVEELLCTVWSELLKVERVGTNDDFFDLGGHSLLSMQLVSRLRSAFGVRLPVGVVFTARTVAELARTLEMERWRELDPEPGPILPAEEGSSKPLSFQQRRLWLLHQVNPNEAVYHIPSALRLRGPLHREALDKAFTGLIQRHESLRTTFGTVEGELIQIVAPPVPMGSPWIDLRSHPAHEREAEAHRRAQEEMARPFDLQAGPLLRILLLRLDDQDHVVALVMHHIVSDGWSMDLLVHELVTLYEAFRAGDEPKLPDLPIQYGDYAAWQRCRLTGEVLERHLDFWRGQLGEPIPHLELPADRPRPETPSLRGGTVQTFLKGGTYAVLGALGRRRLATPFMLLLAAWNTLLHRYSGQEDLLVGTPIAGRSRVEVEGIVGFFVNTLVLRNDLSGEPTFVELLDRVRARSLDAYAHDELPFDRLVEELQPERRSQETPFFQVAFTLVNSSRSGFTLPGIKLQPFGIEVSSAKFDLTLSGIEYAHELLLEIEYSSDLYDRASAERMLRHLQTLLYGIAEDSERTLQSLSLLTASELEQATAGWNQTATGYPRDACIHELFEAQARRAPGRMAVVHEGRTLTYGELDQRSEVLAGRLNALGVGPEVLVGLLMDRSLEMIVAMVGILKAGGAYLPFDPSHPRDRLALMLEDSGAGIVLTHQPRAADVPDGSWRLLAVEDLVDGADGDPALRRAIPDNLAYVIYTSGSTGMPKGVAVPHRAIVRLVRDTNYVSLTEHDCIAQVSNASFDAATFEIWGALANGGRFVIIDKETALSPSGLAAVLRREWVSTMFLTTALFQQVVRQEPEAFSTLRQVLFGGEAVDPHWARELLAGRPPERLLHVYGPTESTTFASWHHVLEVPAEARTISIGLPLSNTTIYGVDKGFAPVPAGVPGELLIGADGLARGYLRRPALTAEKFVPNPFGPPGSRLYRTGDLVRREDGGAILFLSRVDHQVKLRGFRVELGEIEAALLRHPEVESTVVIVREDAPGDKALIAYVVPKSGSLDVRELKPFLKQSLPDYMVPSSLIPLEALPLTPNGKIDRAALPEPDLRGVGEGYVGSRKPLEEVLAVIWSQVLGLETLGVHDDFFDLGGNSLLVTRLIARLHETFHVEIPVRRMFEAPTIAAIAQDLEDSLRAGGGQTVPDLLPVPRVGELPLSFSQQRLWFLDQLLPEGNVYNISSSIWLQGVLKVGTLRRSLNEIVRRHEVLRSRFLSREGRPVLVLEPEIDLELPMVDLQALPASMRYDEVQRLAGREARRPFSLAHAPLLRVLYVKTREGEQALLPTVHHIVFDGWSAGILFHELDVLYRAFSGGHPPPLPELPVQYADYADWQRRWLSGEFLEQQLAYWRQQLADAPEVLELPLDRPRPSVQTFRGANRSAILPGEPAKRIQALSREQGVTPFMAMLAAFSTLLFHYSGQERIAVGTPIANRTRSETEKLIGFFANTIVLCSRVEGQRSFRDLLIEVRDVSIGAYTHQDVPFEKLVDELQPHRNLAHQPLFQVMFLFEGRSPAGGNVVAPEIGAGMIDSSLGAAKFDMTLFLEESGTNLHSMLEFNVDLFDGATAGRLLQHFGALLQDLADDPGRNLAELSLLWPAERHQILTAWNDTELPCADPPSLHQLFEAQADLRPEATAAVFGRREMTYGELEARSNRIAHHLRCHGVRRGSLVAIYMERSLEMIPALLGILKAGGAYVPLDTSYPAARIEWILSNFEIGCMISQTPLLPAVAGLRVPALRDVLCLDAEAAGAPSLESADFQVTADLADLPVTRVEGAAGADDTAYIIFTSGSTGTPKGVVVRHRPVLNLIDWVNREHGVGTGDRLLFITSLCFDLSVYDVFGILAAGGSLHIAAAEEVGEPQRLLDLVRHAGITFWDSAPAALQQLVPFLDLLGDGAGGERLRLIFLSGDWIPVTLPDRVRRVFPASRTIALGGATEATVWSNFFPVDAVDPQWVSIPYGRPIQNARYYVLGPGLLPCPVGVPGDLFIAGDCLCSVYAAAPALTADRFLPDPFTGKPGGRMYRTGDRARFRPDGNLQFLGRADHQVKLRGFRIELGEIESTLRSHPGVGEAIVIVREDQPGDRRLVAYLLPDEGERAETEALRRFVKDRLPDYMVPSAFVHLEAFPMTPNGKVDRRAFPAPGRAVVRDDRSLLPRDTIELQLIQVWEELLNTQPVRIDDDFFELGGDSLIAVQLIARIRQLFHRDLPLATLFQSSTILRLAHVLRQDLRDEPLSPLVAIQPQGSLPPLFCIHAIGGEVLSYYELAQCLGLDQPLYGLQAPAPAEIGDEPISLGETAARYIEAIREISPHGPYHLAGYSYGGVVAFEMAQQLRPEGEEVAFLALLDGFSPLVARRGRTRSDVMMLTGFARELARRSGQSLDLTNESVEALPPDDAVRYILDLLLASSLLPPEIDLDWVHRFLHGIKARERSLADYQPKVYDGEVTVFSSTEADPETAMVFTSLGIDIHDPVRGWDKLTSRPVRVFRLPGFHETILQSPQVEVLADYIRTCLMACASVRTED
jgi:amino acid adenylation domain-containing protein